MQRTIAITILALTLTGCQAIAEVAYDYRADEEASRCGTIISHPERQACMARARALESEANKIRNSR